MKKKIWLPVLLCAAVISTTCPTVTLAGNVRGYQSTVAVQKPVRDEKGVYQIGEYEELVWFSRLVNGTLEEEEKNMAACAVLTKDIVANEQVLKTDGSLNGDGSLFDSWEPVGDKNSRYTGTFDGQGHRISGLYYNDSEGCYAGLFGRVRNGSVKNVTICDSYMAGREFVGGIVGDLTGGVVENCRFDGTVKGTFEGIGGIAGGNFGTVRRCHNTGLVASADGCQATGGIAGANYSSVETCTNAAVISGQDFLGGITGYNQGTVSGCVNQGDISSSGQYLGGIAGYGTTLGFISDCGNIGDVLGGTNSYYVGGIQGCDEANGVTSVERCYNTGAVTGKMYIGGIAGKSMTAIIDCYNTGEISGQRNVGGVAGMSYKRNGTVTNCYNIGMIRTTGESYQNIDIGAVVGSGSNSGGISNCYHLMGCGGFYDNNKRSTVKTEEEFASGEVTYLLNAGVVNGTQVWHQTVGMGFPAFDGDVVYAAESGYTNEYREVIQVEISWTSMEFTYTDGQWNPETHDYDDGVWNCPGGEIMVKNNGNVTVKAAFTYERALEGIVGSFTRENVSIAPGVNASTKLSLRGEPQATMEQVELGAILVEIVPE